MDNEIAQKLARLEAYERMHADMIAQLEKTTAQVNERKTAGRMKGATGNQLLAQKMMYKNIVSTYALYDIPAPKAAPENDDR